MYHKVKEFITDWEQEAKLTDQVLAGLTDESLRVRITPEHRTLGQLAWHLVESIHYVSKLGLSFNGVAEYEAAPDSALLIREQYERVSSGMLQAVKEQWTDETLEASQEVYGEVWRNGASLLFLIKHQAHHRGQMTVLMRQAGLALPDVYGPTKEGWAAMGMEPLL